MGGHVQVTTEARDAVEDADVVYTDTWISMGQEGEREQRLEAFQRYQVNDRLLNFAPGNALVMHCLPAHRGEEITDAVLDGPRSLILDQAENRLHAQKAIIVTPAGWGAAVTRSVKKVVLAYSGGLDTSVILRWLIETYRCEVVAYCADLGQGEELIPVSEKALRTGASTRPHRGSAGRVRPRLRLPDAPRQRGLRGLVPHGHLDRAAPHRQGPGGGGAEGGGGRGEPRGHRQGQRPGALRADLRGPRPRT